MRSPSRRGTAFPALQELPTVAESGLKGYESSQWYGLLAPGGNARRTSSMLLNAHIVKIMHGADMKQRMAEEGGAGRGQHARGIRRPHQGRDREVGAR